MTKKIKCQTSRDSMSKIKVRIIRAPSVDTHELRNVITARAKAIVL